MNDNVLKIAVDIARDAGDRIRESFGKQLRIEFKGAVDPVTEVDTEVETLIFSRLREAFPDHRVYGEESGGETWQIPEPVWLVDPLDGTTNFSHGFPHVCVSMSLMVEGEPLVGVIHDPLREETFAAQRGEGATLNGELIEISEIPHLDGALLATGFPYDRRVTADNNAQMFDYFLRRCQGLRRAGSAALDLAYVAAGRLDGYWEPRLHPWDILAGILIVREAGGRVTDYGGGSERLYVAEEVVASNGLIHDEMLRVLREGAAAPHPDFPELS